MNLTQRILLVCVVILAPIAHPLPTRADVAPWLQAEAKVGGTPATGEIKLLCGRAYPKADPHRFDASVVGIMTPNGSITEFDKPRRKTVTIDDQTQIAMADGSTKILTDVWDATVVIIGRDPGAGQPFDARLIKVTDGKTRLITAAQRNDLDRLKELIAAGVDVNEQSERDSALGMAAFCQNTRCVKALIAANADVNATIGYDNQTALMKAVQKPLNTDTILALVAAGADINALDSHGNAVISYATNPESIKAMADQHADMNRKGDGGHTALWMRANDHNIDCVNALISAGAKANEPGILKLVWSTHPSEGDPVLQALVLAGAHQ